VSIAVVLLPFGSLTVLLDWTREIRIAAGLMIVGFSAVLLLYPRHPRWLSRMRPSQVTLWSFTVALLHGAGLMLVPMLLGLCGPRHGKELTRRSHPFSIESSQGAPGRQACTNTGSVSAPLAGHSERLHPLAPKHTAA
jgi:hypothetical protein